MFFSFSIFALATVLRVLQVMDICKYKTFFEFLNSYLKMKQKGDFILKKKKKEEKIKINGKTQKCFEMQKTLEAKFGKITLKKANLDIVVLHKFRNRINLQFRSP